MNRLFLIAASLLLLVACAEMKKSSDVPVADKPASDPAADSLAVRQLITGFYNWYGTHDTVLYRFHLYEGVKKVDEPPYRINWKEVDAYQLYIRENMQWLGEEFLARQRKMLQTCDSAFKEDKEGEIPYGFDYDWYTNSQEEASFLTAQVNKPLPWKMEWAGDYVTVTLRGEDEIDGQLKQRDYFPILVKKENGQWKIARIGTEE